MKIKIAFIISGLDVGGAQMMLFKLLSKIDRDRFTPNVISLVAHPAMIEKFHGIDIPVRNLDMGKGVSLAKGIGQLFKFLQDDKPQIVQTWMYHADLLGGICAKIAGRQPIIWNIRHSNLDANIDKKSTIMTAKICAHLSRFLPSQIVCCSETAKSIHEKLGYDQSKIVVIPNGFDLNAFCPDIDARHKVRTEIGVSENKILIGLVGRYHPQKDHSTFILAAAQLTKKIEGLEFLLCGNDIDWQNNALVKAIEEVGLRHVFHLLGVRQDITSVTAALDIATSSSSCGEGFPNTIGEAMSCGVPCVVTDVGDSAMIVGSAGKVVPPSNPSELSRAWLELILAGEAQRHEIGLKSRNRVVENFSINKIVDTYQDLYLRALRQYGPHPESPAFDYHS